MSSAADISMGDRSRHPADWRPHVQVQDGYYNHEYDSNEAWIRYYWSIQNVMKRQLHEVMEVGVGSRVVSWYLRNHGVNLKTLDIDPSLEPDHVGSVTEMPFESNSFDGVLCCEVLEHMPFEHSQKALRELHRVTRRWAFVSVPHCVLSFSFLLRLPVFQQHEFRLRVPCPLPPPKRGEHFWEMGMRGYSQRRIRRAMTGAGFVIRSQETPPTNYSAAFFVLEKT